MSAALQSFGEILADPNAVGLCPADVQYVLEGVEAEGYRTDPLIDFRTLTALGLEKTHQGGSGPHP